MVDNVQDDSHPDKPRKPTHVIGVGASAGGLEALQILFRRIPANLDAAFVVVQHLSPDFPSLMDELLSRSSNLKIEKARDGVELEANRIYLNQPGQLLRVVENSLVMTPAPPGHRLLLPIDELFKSLAHSHENRAAGVVLSGSGSDGSRGIMALREVGALVLVQNPDEAQFDGMPKNAIDTGIVDQVLPLRELAETLISYITHSVVKRHDRDFRLYLSERPQALEQVLSKISKQTGLDFRAYKESTIARRIQHRMGITNMRELEDYGDYIAENPDEIDMVRRDLLIGVTQFFRDADVWEMLKAETILPLIQQVKEGDTIRVWCAGCSSGEEAYTLGILFLEAMRKLDVNHSVKIFASDVDQSAISIGAAGVYPANISAEVPPELLDRYFNPVQGSSYQVSPELRSLVVFACHNLIED
ncbi:MAG: chemotaxis protein CheB, partial [Oceanobacter sp.]